MTLGRGTTDNSYSTCQVQNATLSVKVQISDYTTVGALDLQIRLAILFFSFLGSYFFPKSIQIDKWLG